MKIKIYNQSASDIKPIEKLLKRIFRTIKESTMMSVVFVTQDEIQRLNATYRQIDKPTDVLSFPNDDPQDQTLGDIFISLEQARIQASDYNHSFEREVGFLAVHGYLHLKGYDHHTELEEKIMIEKQEEILKRVKLER